MSSARTHLIRLGAAALASAGILGTASGVAGAATSSGSAGSGNSGSRAVPATLDGIKAKANTDITNRVNDLNAAVAKVNAAKGLGSGQATLVTYLGTDISPLQQLNQKIQGDATVRQAAEDFSTIFTGYRVYVLVLPASRIAADADRATNTAIPNSRLLEGEGTRQPTEPGAAPAADRRLEQSDQRGHERDQRPGGHRARRHPGAVECEQRPALAVQVRRPDG
jgi:hypothetical protein